MDIVRSIAYFSMEIDHEDGMPTYSGGLGILAGDTISSGANVGFARRTASYKRADLLLSDLNRLKKIVSKAGRI